MSQALQDLKYFENNLELKLHCFYLLGRGWQERVELTTSYAQVNQTQALHQYN